MIQKPDKMIFVLAFMITMAIAPFLGRKLFAAPEIFQIEYFSGDSEQADNAVEKLLVYESDKPWLAVDPGSFEHNEEKGRYEYLTEKSGDGQNVPLTILGNKLDKFSLTLSYRLTDENAELSEEGVKVSRYSNGVLEEQKEFLFCDYSGGLWGGSGAGEIHYVYYPFFSLGVILYYFGFLVICCILLLAVVAKQGDKLRQIKCVRYLQSKADYIYLAFFAFVCFMAAAYLKNEVYLVTNDTESYCIESFGELSWFYRMPVYQTFLLLIKRITHLTDWMDVFPYVVGAQVLIAIIGVLALYDSAKKILQNKYLATLAAYSYAVLMAVYGYTEVIRVESLSISEMAMMIWLIIKVITTAKKRYIAFSCAMAVVSVFTKPSFLFLLPILALFFFVYIAWERKYDLIKWVGRLCFVCLIVLFAYCRHNESLTGHFMLSSVTYHNQVGIMFANDMYRNPDYPEITAVAEEMIANCEASDYLASAKELCNKFGYSEVAEYLKSCRRLYAKQYFRQILSHTTLEEGIIELYMPSRIAGKNVQVLFEIIRTLLMPFNFGALLVLMLIELIYGFAVWIRQKTLPYMSFGTVGCLLGTYVISIVSLYDASLQRYVVHIIPLAVLLVAMQIDHLAADREALK